jgi:hypothetical protein
MREISMTRTRLILSLVVMLAGSAVLTLEARQYTPSKADSDNYRGKPCNDPWINIAYRLQDNSSPPGKGAVGACDVRRYRGGQWRTYEELRQAVAVARAAYVLNNIVERIVPTSQGYRLETLINNQSVGSALIGQDGASLIYSVADLIGKGGAGATAIVAAGGGNIVAGGGGNIVAAGGGNIKEIAPGIFMRSVKQP